MPNLTYETRAWIYRVVVALLGLAVALKWIAPDSVQPIVNVVAIVLGLGASGLAVKNTPRSTTPPK